MLDCLVTIKATMGVLQTCIKELTHTLDDNHKVKEFLRRFVKVIVMILKNGKALLYVIIGKNIAD